MTKVSVLSLVGYCEHLRGTWNTFRRRIMKSMVRVRGGEPLAPIFFQDVSIIARVITLFDMGYYSQDRVLALCILLGFEMMIRRDTATCTSDNVCVSLACR